MSAAATEPRDLFARRRAGATAKTTSRVSATVIASASVAILATTLTPMAAAAVAVTKTCDNTAIAIAEARAAEVSANAT